MILWKVVLDSVPYIILLMSGHIPRLRHVSLPEMLSWRHFSFFVHVTSLDENFHSTPLGTLVPHQPVTWPSSQLPLEVSLRSAKEPMDRQKLHQNSNVPPAPLRRSTSRRTWTEDITMPWRPCVDNDDDTCIVCPYPYLGVMCNFCCLKTLIAARQLLALCLSPTQG